MEEDAEYLKNSVEEMCQHKLWNARLRGYELAIKQFEQIEDEKSPEWNKYLSLVHKFAIDENIVAREKGLEVVLAYVEKASNAAKSCGEVTSGLIAKCFSSPKTKIKDKALDIIMMYIEIGKQEFVQDELIKGLSSKTPKTVIACIQALRQALRDFGPKVITIKKFVKQLPAILEDRDKDVREEAKLLTVEVYRWSGAAYNSHLDNLKPAKLKELEFEFSKLSGIDKALPVKFLRSQQATKIKLAQQSCQVSEQGEESKGFEDIANDFNKEIQSVDILSQLPKNFYEKCEAKRWQERKEAVDTLLPLTSHPKFVTGNYADLIRILQIMISKDANVMVVAVAGKCLAGLAKGLKKKFQPYLSQCFPCVLEKFKEKNQNVVQAMREAADAMFLSNNLDYIQDYLLEYLLHKNPSIKAETAGFMARAFAQSNSTTLTKKSLNIYVPSLLKALNDSDPCVRDNAAQALGIAMNVVGEKIVMPLITQADSAKLAKIMQNFELAKTTDVKLDNKSKVISSKVVDKFEPISKKSSKSNSEKECAKTKPESMLENELTPKEVEEKAAEVLPSEILIGLGDANWKTRLTAMEQFINVISKNQTDVYQTQALVRTIIRKPGLKDSNFQVLKIKLEALSYLAAHSKFTKRSAMYVLDELADKIGDAKNGSVASETLTEIAESTTLEFVALHVFEYVFSKNRPKNQLEAINWLNNSLKEFGLIIQVKLFIEHIKKALAATGLEVRASSITLLGNIYLYMGSDLRDFFKNVKPIVLQQIDAEFDKVKGTNPPLPVRGVKHQKTLVKVEDINDNLGERTYESNSVAGVDISSQITPDLLSGIDSINWKEKLEALKNLSDIINKEDYIVPYLGNLPSVFSARLRDPNKNLAIEALTVCRSLGIKMGSGCKKYVGVFAPAIFISLGDEKEKVRLSALNCLMTWVTQCGVQPFLENEMLPDAFKLNNSCLTFELLGWLTKVLPTARSLSAGDLVLCLPFLYSALEKSSKENRNKAQESVLPFMLHVGYERMMKATSKLKPNLKTEIVAILNEAKLKVPVRKITNLKVKTSESISVYHHIKENDDAKKEPDNAQENSLPCEMPENDTEMEDEKIRPAMIANEKKKDRCFDDCKGLKWTFTSPEAEHIELLKNQITEAGFNKQLLNCLFSDDFQSHLKALEIFSECLEKLPEASVANVDLILKWISLRFYDANSKVITSVLKYLETLLKFLYNMIPTYNLNDYEIPLFIPHLILSAGNDNDAIRKDVRSCLKLTCKLLSPSKMFAYLMNGLPSANSHLRTECLDELCSLLTTYGINVCLPNQIMVLENITKLLSDPVQSVRDLAMNWLMFAYEEAGNQIFDYIRPNSPSDLRLLKERIKNISPRENPLSLAANVNATQRSIDQRGNTKENSNKEKNRLETKQPRSTANIATIDKEEVISSLVAAIMQLGNSNKICTSVEAISHIDVVLKSEVLAGAITPYLNSFLKAIIRQYHFKLLPLERNSGESTLLLYQSLNETLNLLLSYPSIIKRASKKILKDLLLCLLRIYVNNQISEFSSDGTKLVKATNDVIVRLIERADLTNIACSFIELIQELIENKITQEKLKESIIKCMWKILDLLSKKTVDVNLREILSTLHNLLESNSILQRWEESNEAPFRVVKKALQIVAENYGKEVFNQLSLLSETRSSKLEKFLNKLQYVPVT